MTRVLALVVFAALVLVDQRIAIRIAPPPPSEPPPASGQALLTEDDFTELGHFDVAYDGNNSGRQQGLTHRYVGGELRFLRYRSGTLTEFKIAGLSFGASIAAAQVTNTWTSVGCLNWNYHNFWYEESTGRLHTLSGNDYDATPRRIDWCTRELHPTDHTVSNVHGPVGLQGFSAKRLFGNVFPVPQWFRDQYADYAYALLGGGYTSLMHTGGGAAIGTTFFLAPDLSGFSANTDIPSGQFVVLSNQYTGNSTAYGSGWNVSYDRGARLTGRVENYLDCPNDERAEGATGCLPILTVNGQCNTSGTTVTWLSGTNGKNFNEVDHWWPGETIRINGVNYTIDSVTNGTTLELTTSAGTQSNVAYVGPATRPVADAGDNWGDPAPDGDARMTWSDFYGGAGAWITGTNKHGIVRFGDFGCGKVWYGDARLKYDDRCYELHIFDPHDYGDVVQGEKNTFEVQPTHMAALTLSGDNSALTGESAGIQLFPQPAATYDETTKRLYLVVPFQPNANRSRLYVYEVNDDPAAPAPEPAAAPSHPRLGLLTLAAVGLVAAVLSRSRRTR